MNWLIGFLTAATLFLVGIPAYGREATSSLTLEELKMDRRFGLGLAAGGAYALLGIEADVNLTENLSISGGIGTGGEFSTFSVKARYFLLGRSVSPYVGAGMARWWSDGTRAANFGPSVLMNRFLEPGTNPENGFSVFILYPALGVQYLHGSGFSFSAEVQYFFRVFSFANGTYAGLSAHWYF